MVTVAVVPIFVSAGAALAPTIIAAIVSVAAIIFKPRELIRVCRLRPLAALATVATIAFVILITIWWTSSPSKTAIAKTARYDWAKVAEELIARQRVIETASTPAAPVNLQKLWSFAPEETMFLSNPLIAGGRIYAAGCQSDLGGYTGLLACLDGETGKPIWQITQLGAEPLLPFFSSPTLTPDGKYLIIGQGLHQDRNCSLLCFDAATGKLVWKVKTPLHIESSPAIRGDMVVVGVGAIEGTDRRAIGDPGFVMAVRISDGKQLWRQPLNDAESSPAIDENGTVYAGSGFNGKAIVSIDSSTDKTDRIIWRTESPHPMIGGVTLAGDLVISGGGNGDAVHSDRNPQGIVLALDRKTGQKCWQTTLDDAVLGTLNAHDGMVICPVRTGEVVALSLQDGKIIWRAKVSGQSPVLAGCAFTAGRVYAISGDANLVVIDSKNGKVLERHYLNDQSKPGSGLSMSDPQVANGRVYVGTETGGLVCLVGGAGK